MAQRQYSEKFKKSILKRLTGPGKVSAASLAREVGVTQPTLSRWLREAGRVAGVTEQSKEEAPVERRQVERRPEDWSAQEKLAAVLEAASKSVVELGMWLRKKGLTEEHLRLWRGALEERAESVFSPPRPEKLSAAERKRVRALEKELRRKEKALAEAAALLVLQGKVKALWAEEDDATGPNSDESSLGTLPRLRRRGRG